MEAWEGILTLDAYAISAKAASEATEAGYQASQRGERNPESRTISRFHRSGSLVSQAVIDEGAVGIWTQGSNHGVVSVDICI